MLKNKKAMYILLPLTLIIWGLIGYKIYLGLKDESGPDETVSDFTPAKILNKASDTFSLFNNYRDPFLTGIHKAVNSSSFSKPAQPTMNTGKNGNTIKPALPLNNDWPPVHYSGLLKNQSNSVSLVLLSINGKTYTLKQGDVAEELKVIAFTNEEVTLLRGKEKKNFSR
ncbi:MAG TPA: hypothetical protein VNY73_06475 [Bacteroidia bacterium]|jgi:hypothetical protein|nr:hypothetical protein [Bacteroidia bacterium]